MLLTRKQLNQIKDYPPFYTELMVLLEAFRQGGGHKEVIASMVENDIDLIEACSYTWLTYNYCNCTDDEHLEGVYLSEIVVDIEDLVDDMKFLVEKYKKDLNFEK